MAETELETDDVEAVKHANIEQQATRYGLQRQQQDGLYRDVLEYLAETDINTESKKWLRDLLTRDYVFANLNGPELTEIKWELRYLKEIFFMAHPPQGSLLQGELRAAIHDDPWDRLSALSDKEKQEVEALFRTVRMRATRGKHMDQQKVLQTSIAETNVRKPDDSGTGGVLGRLRR